MAFHILVVDDLETNRLVLAEALLRDGYEVSTADGGEAAMQSISERVPDLVLLDVMMPGLTGIDVCQQIRAQPATSDIAVILVTALADRESRLAGFAADADDYLTKPVDASELRLRVRTMARLRRYRKLLEERSRSEMIADRIPDAVILCQRDGRVVESNTAAQAMFAGVGAIVGRVLSEIVEVADPVAREWLSGMDTTPPAQPRSVHAEVSGRERVLEISRVWHHYQGRDLAIVVARDVTELDRLRSSAERLRRHEAIAVAATGIAHDFRNYLTAVELGLGLLQHELPGCSDAALETIRTVQEQIQVGLALTRKITSISQDIPEPALPEGLDLQTALRSMAPLLQHWAGDATLVLDIQPTPPIAASGNDVVQVVSNLVVNARQAVGVDGEIIVRTRVDAVGGILLEVSDNGVGMSPETLARIFEAYFSTKARQGGTGLGLAIVHQVVTARGGTITVDSKPGAGSLFTVLWPASGVLSGPRE